MADETVLVECKFCNSIQDYDKNQPRCCGCGNKEHETIWIAKEVDTIPDLGTIHDAVAKVLRNPKNSKRERSAGGSALRR